MIGEHAHQKPHSERGPRGLGAEDKPWEHPIDSTGPATYENTILLCGGCHTTVDQAPKAHSVEVLQEMKRAHEGWVRRRLDQKRAKTEPPTGYKVEIVVKEDLRPVKSLAGMRVSRRESPLDALWPSTRKPQPRVMGVKAGPPQTLFDVFIINRGTVSLQMVEFRLIVDGIELVPVGANFYNEQPSRVFAVPLEPYRSQKIEIKANHVATYLRNQGVTQPVRLTFCFVDACGELFTKNLERQFVPTEYEDLPDAIGYSEW